MRHGFLWSNVVFHEFDLENSELDFEVSKSSIWKHTMIVWQGCFFFHYYLATSTTTWAQIFYRFVSSCICWDTPSEKTGLWQLPTVSIVFNSYRIGKNKILKNLSGGFLIMKYFPLKLSYFQDNYIWNPKKKNTTAEFGCLRTQLILRTL